jgi:hypothetical protein
VPFDNGFACCGAVPPVAPSRPALEETMSFGLMMNFASDDWRGMSDEGLLLRRCRPAMAANAAR